MANPTWITSRNQGGYSCLQLLCRSGRLDREVLALFIRIAGVEQVLATPDPLGNTCLHSAMRRETDISALQALILAFPAALQSKTTYGDTPLHLACLRRMDVDVVRQIIVAGGLPTLLLAHNRSGQTPISIVLEYYQQNLRKNCDDAPSFSEENDEISYQLLVLFARILYHGNVSPPDGDNALQACIALHRRNVRLHPAFLCQVIQRNPAEVHQCDENGYYPIHIEASIPIEKMSLLNGHCTSHSAEEDQESSTTTTDRCRYDRAGILRRLLDLYPKACEADTPDGFLLPMLLENGRSWDATTAMVAQLHPPAVARVRDMAPQHLLRLVGRDCGNNTMFQVLRSRPSHFVRPRVER